jgi:hypothetical protein
MEKGLWIESSQERARELLAEDLAPLCKDFGNVKQLRGEIESFLEDNLALGRTHARGYGSLEVWGIHTVSEQHFSEGLVTEGLARRGQGKTGHSPAFGMYADFPWRAPTRIHCAIAFNKTRIIDTGGLHAILQRLS